MSRLCLKQPPCRRRTDATSYSYLITDFYTVRACSTARSLDERLALLEGHGMRLRGFEAELSSELRTLPSSESRPEVPAASGVRKSRLPVCVGASCRRLTF